MISSAASSPSSVLPPPTPSSDNTTPSSSSDQDSPASFNDVMNQQEGTPGQSDKAPTPQGATPPAKTPAGATATAAATTPKTPAKAASLAPVTNLSTLIVQASVAASNAKPATPASPAAPAPATPTTNTPTDLPSLIAEATAILSGSAALITGKGTGTSATSTDKTSKDSGTATNSTKASTTSTTASTPIDLSTLIAQTSILAQTTPASTGKDLPSAGLTTGSISGSAKEKKSTSSSVGGSFLQSGTGGTSATSSAFGMLSGLQSLTSGVASSQQVTTKIGAENNSAKAIAATAASTAGTANVEKEKAMSTELNIPEMTLLSGNGGNVTPSQNGADLHIQLTSNSQFTDALKQVMHVAQLTQTSGSSTPLRVEMEIQTPPGAVVNVYVSKQGDGWRAQLSTNDPAALSWVQDQVTSLRQSGDLGSDVKWLPPQLEGSSSITTAGSQDANLSWNQGGQGQQDAYQQPDERQQQGRQQNAEATPEMATAASQFMNTLSELGRAA